MTERIPGEVQPTSPIDSIDYIADMLCCAQINKKPEGLIVTACVVEIITFFIHVVINFSGLI